MAQERSATGSPVLFHSFLLHLHQPVGECDVCVDWLVCCNSEALAVDFGTDGRDRK